MSELVRAEENAWFPRVSCRNAVECGRNQKVHFNVLQFDGSGPSSNLVTSADWPEAMPGQNAALRRARRYEDADVGTTSLRSYSFLGMNQAEQVAEPQRPRKIKEQNFQLEYTVLTILVLRCLQHAASSCGLQAGGVANRQEPRFAVDPLRAITTASCSSGTVRRRGAVHVSDQMEGGQQVFPRDENSPPPAPHCSRKLIHFASTIM